MVFIIKKLISLIVRRRTKRGSTVFIIKSETPYPLATLDAGAKAHYGLPGTGGWGPHTYGANIAISCKPSYVPAALLQIGQYFESKVLHNTEVVWFSTAYSSLKPIHFDKKKFL